MRTVNQSISPRSNKYIRWEKPTRNFTSSILSHHRKSPAPSSSPAEASAAEFFPKTSTSISTMTQSSCLCGSNVITYNDSPIVKFRCHYTDERKLTGAAFALNILLQSNRSENH
ncbi:hypothetical protein WAI453_006817 [Rhynchosporium graminicola]